ncbi:MAG: prepilin-type N-terminal cleavage/methylation domain-containing protein [Candidatus Gastranaerophilales bacterium]|nr:prepilin-type N-terminal cleavage/methylation domain-containing protein [Candidatus Gastranaerophilales bacterium]
MQNNKKGFTLSEVLVCLMIVGIIMALSVNSIKIVKESYVSLAYYAFKNLQGMVTELFSGPSPAGSVIDLSYNGIKISYLTRQCINSNGNIIQVLKSDDEAGAWNTPYCSARGGEGTTDGNGYNFFCNALAQISNTSGTIDCSNLSAVNFENSDKEPYISGLTTTPNFITTNGQRFYVSEWVAPSDTRSVSSEFGYRLVGIDLNGTSNPNITDNSNSSIPPDIVTFMVLDNGEVFPLGVAADNYVLNNNVYLYINARLKGYYYSTATTKRDSDTIPEDCKVNGTCDYAVVPVQQVIKYGSKADNERTHAVFSYREAYCGATDSSKLAYPGYCPSDTYGLCPGGTPTEGEEANQPFDLCRIDTVKPAFRFSFD